MYDNTPVIEFFYALYLDIKARLAVKDEATNTSTPTPTPVQNTQEQEFDLSFDADDKDDLPF